MTTSTTPAIKFVNIEQHMTSEQAGINAQLLAEGYSRQQIVVTFIAGCYGVAMNHVRLLGRTQYVVRGLDAQCALPVNIVRYLTPLSRVVTPVVEVKADARTPEQTKAAVERTAKAKPAKTSRPKAGTPTTSTPA